MEESSRLGTHALGSRGWGLSVCRGTGLHGCIVSSTSAQRLGAAIDDSHVSVSLGMDFCRRSGKGVRLRTRGQRVEVIGKRMVYVMDHECRERREARSWLADGEKING